VSEKVTISYHLVAGPGAEGEVSIYSVPPGQVLSLRAAQVAFPAGTYGELHIRLLYGNLKVWPATDHVSGDNVLVRKEVDVKYFSGDRVLIWYRNTNATETRDAFISLEGVLG